MTVLDYLLKFRKVNSLETLEKLYDHLNYSLTSTEELINMIQAQRDYFGAHTFERTDELRGQFFHENWTGHGGDTKSGTYNV